jgi:predicted MFS family arabinose efflux permease
VINKAISLYRSSFTGLSKETWLLSLIMLINRSGTMVLPFMTLYLTSKEVNRSLSDAGTVMGLFGLGSVIGAYYGGKLSDKIGFHKVQLISLFLGGLMFILLGQIKSFPLICLVSFILSLVNEAFRPANSSAISFYSNPNNRTRSYSLNRLSINLGWAVGASIGGLIATYNYELLFWVDGITNILAAFLLLYFMKAPSYPIAHTHDDKEVPEAISAYKDKTYLWFVLWVTLFAFCFFQLFTTIPKYFRDDLHLKESYIGLLMAVNGGIIVLLEMVIVFYLESRRSILFYIPVGLIICAVSFLSLLIPGPEKLISLTFILLITVGEIVSMPFMNTYWTRRSNDKNRGQYAALYIIAWGIAQVLGPYVCSHVVEASSFNLMFVLMAVLLVISAFGFTRLTTK